MTGIPRLIGEQHSNLPRVALKIVPVAALAVYSFGVYLSLDFIGVNGFVTLLVYAAIVTGLRVLA